MSSLASDGFEREIRIPAFIDKKTRRKIGRQYKDIFLRIRNIGLYSLEEINSNVFPMIDDRIDKHMEILKTWKREGTSWYDTSDTALYETAKVAIKSGRAEEWDAVRRLAFKMAKNLASKNSLGNENCAAWFPAYVVGLNIAKYAAWEVVKDLPGFEDNPFEYCMQLYEMGLRPAGFRESNGKELYCVDLPRGKDKNVGHYGHNDGKLLYDHSWIQNCKELKLVPNSANK